MSLWTFRFCPPPRGESLLRSLKSAYNTLTLITIIYNFTFKVLDLPKCLNKLVTCCGVVA